MAKIIEELQKESDRVEIKVLNALDDANAAWLRVQKLRIELKQA